jgi:hypothetical protein
VDRREADAQRSPLNGNPLGIERLVNGEKTREPVA